MPASVARHRKLLRKQKPAVVVVVVSPTAVTRREKC